MKIKKLLMGVFILVTVNSLFASEAWMKIATNAKVDTNVYVVSKNYAYSLEDAIEIFMYIASAYDGEHTTFDINIYKKSDLLSSKDFEDEYIYGSAVMAIVNLGYGIVQADYFRYDDEKENLVGWVFALLSSVALSAQEFATKTLYRTGVYGQSFELIELSDDEGCIL